MLQPERMRKIEVLVLEKDLRRVTAALGAMRALHLTQAVLETGTDIPETVTQSAHEGDVLFARVEELCQSLSIEPKVEVAADLPSSLESIRDYVNDVRERMDAVVGRLGDMRDEETSLLQLVSEMETFKILDLPVERINRFSFLHFAIGSIVESSIDTLERESGSRTIVIPFRTDDGDQKVVAITDRKGRWALEGVLAKLGFKDAAIPSNQQGLPSEILRNARLRLGKLEAEKISVESAIERIGCQESIRLTAVWNRLRIEKRLREAEQFFAHTSATGVIAGWVPQDRLGEVKKELISVTRNRCVIDERAPKECGASEEVPVLLKHSSLLRPFEMLVRAYGVPRYGQIEPTFFVAITFVGMFGMMFGDVGHGLVLAVAGLCLRKLAESGQWRDAGVIFGFSGLSAALFGVLYGEVFGYPVGWLPSPKWAPMHMPERFLMFAVFIGIGMISLAVILNIVNRILRRDYAMLFFDKYGVVGIVFYWGALGLIIRYVLSNDVSGWHVAFLVIAPLVILLFREPLQHLIGHVALADGNDAVEHEEEKGVGSVASRAFEAVIEVYEAVSVYLANTVSFVRVGAFALAHAGLCAAIFSLESVVRSFPAGPVLSVLVIVSGNLLVIVLEGMVVSIQCVRLQFYECFSKFFVESGRSFVPFDLRR